MAEKKSDAPHPAQVQLHLAQAQCPEEHAAQLAGLGLDWPTLQLILSLARQYGPQVWVIVTQLIAQLKGQPATESSEASPGAARR